MDRGRIKEVFRQSLRLYESVIFNAAMEYSGCSWPDEEFIAMRPTKSRQVEEARRVPRRAALLDPKWIEYLWHKLYAGFNSLGSHGFVSALMSGVDIALWDIRGKELGLPIHQLLGGTFHERLLLYSNGWFTGCSTPAEFARAAARTVADGHTALKLDPFRRGHPYLSRYAASYPPEDDLEAVETVAQIREAVGPGVEIFIDAHGRFDVPTAVRLANRLAPFNIGWFEEPVPPENWDALRQFREHAAVPVCVGERLYTRWQFRPVLEQQLAEYLMPDIIRTGGISEMKKIATMAEAFFGSGSNCVQRRG
jgi:galactonate dehydratase